MIQAIRDDFEKRFARYVSEGKMEIAAAYGGNEQEAQEWKEELEQAFPGYDIHIDPLSLSVACHIGQGALAVACAKRVDLE